VTAFDDGFGEETARRGDHPGVSVSGALMPRKNAAVGGGAFEGADRLGRELQTWAPPIKSADQIIGKDKLILDGRALDLMRNNGPTVGAANTQKDSIVGAQYRLNANPAFRYLGLSEQWADEFQMEVEEMFTLYAESDAHWVDVERKNTLTGMVRLAIGCFFAGGEAVATMNWMKGRRPFRSAMQMIDANRVCNPNDTQDTKFLRRGVVLDGDGAPLGLHIRRAMANDNSRLNESFSWDYWAIRKPWGRLQTLHLLETTRPEQSRGVADMVAALKETRMAKRFHEVALANAIVQASFAAAIESELPPDMAFEMLGGTSATDSRTAASMSMLQAISDYSRGSKNIEIDGTKIPYLFPGTKLKLTPTGGQGGGMGDKLEESLNRYISATLGISYEEYTHDYSQTNYSSLRAATNKTLRSVQSKKRLIADGTANAFYQCWLEEAITEGHLQTTRSLTNANRNWFYDRLNKEALCRATWIGATRGQVDELKETTAAIMRIASGMSTYEIECSKLGSDFRDIYAQWKREKRMQEEMGLDFDLSVTRGLALAEHATDTNNGTSNDGFDD